MPKQKRDYEKLKKEFIASKFTDVKSFIVDRWMTYNSCIRKNAKWWSEEKRDLKARATDKALKKVENKLASQLEPSSEFLLWNISKAIELTKVKLDQMESKWNISVKDLNTIRSMNRIQNWQPTTYVKEEQDVNQNVRIEWIHIILWPNNIDNKENDINNA
jgi:hypothetical protein